jgi:hypothetical protein
MLRWLIARTCEAVLLAALVVGAAYAAAAIAPPGSFGIGGGCKIDADNVLMFQLQVGKQPLPKPKVRPI